MKLVAFVAIVLGCACGALAQGPKVTDIVSSFLHFLNLSDLSG